MVSKDVMNSVERYIKVLLKNGYEIEKVLLYGSYASQSALSDSDIDLAIVLSNLKKERYKVIEDLLKVAWRIDPRIEPIPFSSEIFAKGNWIPIIAEIKEKGIEIRCKNN